MNDGSPLLWLIGGAVAAFGALVLFLATVLEKRRSEPVFGLGDALRSYEGFMAIRRVTPGLRMQIAGLRDRLKGLSSGRNTAEAIDHRLDAAGWPLRSAEFRGIRVGAGVLGALVGYALAGGPAPAVLLAVLAWVAPRILLDNRARRRADAFAEQLPETLLLLAGALESGHSLIQGIGAIVQEASAPTSIEFARVQTEVRLGKSIGRALEEMGDRLGSEEFRWVVQAVGIQQEVGGNLAEVLKTVADALRHREGLRREVQVLSAEGRISGAILSALPVLLLLYIAVANPSYLSRLTGSTAGLLLLGLAFGLMGVGALWIRRIVKVDV